MKLFFRKYGKGLPLIILHGLFGSSDNWVTIARQLEDHFTVFLPDLRNHGHSPHSSTHDYDSMRDDLFELVKELELKKFFLAGHSMGGKVAIKFALKWPEMLHGLLVADISPFENKSNSSSAYLQHSTILKAILSTDISPASTRGEADALLSGDIPSGKIRSMIMKNLRRTDQNNFTWRINAQSLFDNLDKVIEGIDRQTYMSQQITGFPVIFLKGENSDYIPAEDFRDIQRIFPAAEITEIRNAGHWINADRPDEVIKYLKKLKEI